MMDLELKDKVVVLTGATGGIGGAICKDLLLEGAIVNCIIRNAQRGDEFKKHLSDAGIDVQKLHFYTTNMQDFDQLKETSQAIILDHPQIDVLINCAGKTIEYPFAMQSKEQMDEVLDINLRVPMYLCQFFLKPMFAKRSGSIINISSLTANKKGRGVVPYAGAKGGLESFTRALSNEVGKKGIRANCISPGLIVTEMSDAFITRSAELIKSSSSLCRFGTAEEISKAVLFLASEKMSSFVTGECITVDGGIY